jgi:hypothetical protein
MEPMTRELFAAVVVGLAGLACSHARPADDAASRAVPECPTSNTQCLTARDCAFDEAHQCMLCHCGSPYASSPATNWVPPVQ